MLQEKVDHTRICEPLICASAVDLEFASNRGKYHNIAQVAVNENAKPVPLALGKSATVYLLWGAPLLPGV